MNKLSNVQLAEICKDAAATIRSQQAEISDFSEKLATRERRDRVQKIASEMHRKGLELDTSTDVLADRLEKQAEAKLATIEQAVDFAGPDMANKLAQLSNDEPGASPSSSDLERFIVGGVT